MRIRYYKNNENPSYGAYFWHVKNGGWTLDIYFNRKVWAIARGQK